jgi:hypothetical protein
MVGPGIAGRFVGDLGWVESNGRIAGSIQTFRTFLANAQTPGGIIPGGEEKNRKVLGLGR